MKLKWQSWENVKIACVCVGHVCVDSDMRILPSNLICQVSGNFRLIVVSCLGSSCNGLLIF